MTPYEAIRAGLLEGEIPEPFWTVTTTDTTQAGWSIRMTTGAVYVFDWGDGQQTWGTGTGATDAVPHTYASAGTYTIKLYVFDPTKFIRLYAYGNSLVGPAPDITECVNLDYASIYSNYLAGTIPDLTPNVALYSYYAVSNNYTGYTPSTIPMTCVDFRLDQNALTLAAVDQILADFTTGAAGRPAAGTINLSGGTNAAPTPAVKAACIAALPGWTITTNP